MLPCVCHYIPTNWLRATINSGDREFEVPSNYPLTAAGYRTDKSGRNYIRVKGVRCFTDTEHGRLSLTVIFLVHACF
ncbi:adenine-specific methyltransferase EcoRI family protein [Psychrobacter celer]|uniref:adenine-specific methyltransferase EcoRI family protein n=1 Tax=Psychrobacter celer TaxID=306572 RepID=UPI003FD4CD2E